jgi:O-antigen ligase
VLFGVLTLFFAAILASRSRGGLIGAFAVVMVLGVRRPGVNAKTVTMVMMGGLLLAISLYWTRSEGFQNLGQDFTLNQRLETIRAGWQMFLDHPLVGVGIGCSVLAWPLYAPANVGFRGALVIHNTPVQSLAELGLVGFIPLALLVFFAYRRVRQTTRGAEAGGTVWSYAVALEASLVGYLVCGLSGAHLTSWFPYIVIGLISVVAMLAREERGFDAVEA